MYNTQTKHLKFIVRGFKLPAQKQNYIVVWKDQYFISGFFQNSRCIKKAECWKFCQSTLIFLLLVLVTRLYPELVLWRRLSSTKSAFKFVHPRDF